MTEDEKSAIAKRKVQELMAFYVHAGVYAVVIAILFAVNAAVSASWWVQWPALGWGAGLLAHGALVFADTPNFVRNWQARKIEEIKSRL